jgi:hypothetical protein
MKVFNLSRMFDERVCLGGKENGRFLRNEVEIALSKGEVCLDFEDLPLITQSFSDEFLGPMIVHLGRKVIGQIVFKRCTKDVQAILTSTTRRFTESSSGVTSL